MQTATADAYVADSSRWQAVLSRDPHAEGAFYYAVRSTGIYCRPTCPARRPRPEQVVFFSQPEAAERAGFRACLRCHPREVSREQRVVASVQQLLDDPERTLTLDELADQVGMSPFHLHRLFRRATGLTPRAYAGARRAERLKRELRSGSSVTEALYDAGFGSSRALYESAPVWLGMSPGAYRRGGEDERIAYALVDSQLGRLLVAATERGVCAVRFGDDESLRESLRAEFPRAALVDDVEAVQAHVEAILQLQSDPSTPHTVPVEARGTAFQQRVWAALREIPPGETRSYRQVAEAIGQPGAARAVARACASNPVALLVPCHRVVRGDGALGGYRWGAERKRVMLERERSAPS